jgi:hypothetical protein
VLMSTAAKLAAASSDSRLVRIFLNMDSSVGES